MRPTSKGQSLIRALGGHVLMGAGVGTFLSLALAIGDIANNTQVIATSSGPSITTFVINGTLAMTVAIAAAVSGLVLILQPHH